MGEMRYRRLGNSGLVVSAVGLGCNNFGRKLDAAQTSAVVEAALDSGITFFDTADVYGDPAGSSESHLGPALKGVRDEVVLASKFGMPMGLPDGNARGSRRYIMQAVEASLTRLGTDHLDLFQFHTPDPATPIEETLRALDDLVRSGKVRYIGSSQFAAWQVVDAAWTSKHAGLTSFISTTNHYNWLHRAPEKEMLPACAHHGVGFIPFFPLESGLLTGVYRRGEAPPQGTRMANERYQSWFDRAPWDKIEALQQFASDRGVTMLDVAIGGLAAKPGVSSVIAGATSPSQVRANAAAGSWLPTTEELHELDRITA
ncbi:aryl-alcohol dehydrogenase-like predicted oxidoreductase [Allocatelliglobosispora scoriae]|uniref:Aryl-alcohol dehydrogenase-like predicted oxidoreductase n=1 Tax=Allocatelliglobosispora scoriae TaxID=643052 RepID=A0A841BWX8_9ACTN|nr:aryl-alcohol dehydrogenase-like predicted oxidoreductase [Allocatelliglobosispora scoriae]